MPVDTPPTTVGKTLKTTLWVVLSAGVSAVIVAIQAAITAGDFDGTRVATYVPFINIALVFIKNLVDPKVPNA